LGIERDRLIEFCEMRDDAQARRSVVRLGDFYQITRHAMRENRSWGDGSYRRCCRVCAFGMRARSNQFKHLDGRTQASRLIRMTSIIFFPFHHEFFFAYLHPPFQAQHPLHEICFCFRKGQKLCLIYMRTRDQELPACHMSYPLSQSHGQRSTCEPFPSGCRNWEGRQMDLRVASREEEGVYALENGGLRGGSAASRMRMRMGSGRMHAKCKHVRTKSQRCKHFGLICI
jgi:hypothetical protein